MHMKKFTIFAGCVRARVKTWVTHRPHMHDDVLEGCVRVKTWVTHRTHMHDDVLEGCVRTSEDLGHTQTTHAS